MWRSIGRCWSSLCRVAESDPQVCTPWVGRGTNQSRQRDLRHVHHAWTSLTDTRQFLQSFLGLVIFCKIYYWPAYTQCRGPDWWVAMLSGICCGRLSSPYLVSNKICDAGSPVWMPNVCLLSEFWLRILILNLNCVPWHLCWGSFIMMSYDNILHT